MRPEAMGAVAQTRAMRRSRLIGSVWAAAVVLIWAAWFPITRLGITHTLGAADLVAMRVGIGALVLLPVFWRQRRGIARRAWMEAAILAICWGAPFPLLVSEGIRRTTASNAAAITPAIMPVFAAAFAWIALGQRPSRTRMTGLAVIVGGIVLLLAATGGLSAGRDFLLGDAALLVAAALWAVYTLRLRGSGLSPVQAACLVYGYSAALYVPLYFAAGWADLGRASTGELAFQAAYQGVLVGGLSIVGFNQAVAQLGEAGGAVVASMVPVAATVLAYPVLGEVPTLAGALAVGTIAAGVFLAARVSATAPRAAAIPVSTT